MQMKGRFYSLTVVVLGILLITSLVSPNEGRFVLSCRVISNICQNDGACIDEIGLRFPDCFIDGSYSAEMPTEGTVFALNKRAPGVKLLKVLMMKDRIPGGRR